MKTKIVRHLRMERCSQQMPLSRRDDVRFTVAWRILSGWQENVKRFAKVMPVEYRKVLAAAHLDSDAAKLASV